jgi:transposase
MPEMRRKYDAEFREGGVTIVRETGKPIVEVARELGIGAGTLGSWVKRDRLARGEEADRARLDPGYVRRLEREVAELWMERDVLKRSVVLWVHEATR